MLLGPQEGACTAHEQPLSVRRSRAALAALLGGAQDLPAPRTLAQAQVLLPRHVPVPLGRGPARRPPRGLHRDRHRCAATSGCAASTCCTRWAGTPSACPPSSTRIKTGIHPAITTRENIDNFRRQIKRARLLATTGTARSTPPIPSYYKWTQWIFLKLLRARAWRTSPRCRSTGARRWARCWPTRRSIDGKSEGGGFPVVRRPLRQWMLQITAYAERLLDDLEHGRLAGRARKEMQRNWIGRATAPRSTSRSTARTRQLARLHHAARHAVRRDLHGARARASAGRRDHHARAAAPRSKPIARRRRARATCERTELTKEKTGVFTGALRDQPGQRRAASRSGSPTTC